MDGLDNFKLRDYLPREYNDLKLVNRIGIQNMKNSFISGIAYMVDAKEIITKVLLKDDIEIGIGIIMEDYNKDCYEIRYCILREFHNKGYGTVLLKLLNNYVQYSIPDSKRSILSIDDQNIPSIHVAQKNGFFRKETGLDYIVEYPKKLEETLKGQR
jgi:RimJ/RimL family protein N-acetyltransferase